MSGGFLWPPGIFTSAFFLVSIGSIQSIPANDTSLHFAQRISEANAALRNRDFDTAIAGYEAAANVDSSREESRYNKAIALYRKGEVESAESLFSDVARSLDDDLAAKARFNSGNCHFAMAVQIRQTEPAAAIEHLRSAINDYRSALSIAPSDEDTRINIELAAKLLDQLEQQQKQEQKEQQQKQGQRQEQQEEQRQQNQAPSDQQPDSDQQDQSQSGSDQESDDRQNADQKKSEEQQDRGQQAKPQPEQQMNDEDTQPDPQSESAMEDPASGNRQPSDNAAPDRPEQPDETVGRKQEPNEEQDPGGELSATNDSEQSNDSASRKLTGEAESEGKMTEQEAWKMLQAIRDRDMLRRLRRQAAERAGRIPVDKDW